MAKRCLGGTEIRLEPAESGAQSDGSGRSLGPGTGTGWHRRLRRVPTGGHSPALGCGDPAHPAPRVRDGHSGYIHSQGSRPAKLCHAEEVLSNPLSRRRCCYQPYGMV